MTRPFVDLKVKNEMDMLIHHLEGILPRIQSLPGVMGITLNGGLSRGFADHLSEIDITFYLDAPTYQRWNNEKSPIALGIVKFDGVLYDIKILNYADEEKRDFGEVDLWDLSYAKILFDPHKKIDALFDKKLSAKIDVSQAFGHLRTCYWHYRLAGDIWVHRGDVMQGHLMLNDSVKPLIKALFIANQEYVPHEKWLVHMSWTLCWQPDNWSDRLMMAMNTGDFSKQSLVNRQSVIAQLSEEIDQHIKGEHFPDYLLKGHQKFYYDILKYLLENEKVSLKEWEAQFGLQILNTDPLHRITHVSDDKIVLDKEKLISTQPEDLYSWHYEIVQGVIGDLN